MFKVIKELQELNILEKVVIFVVLKLCKSKDINDSHPENIFSIFSTFEVSKLDKSNDVINKQFLNILFIFVQEDVLNLEISIDDKLEHPSKNDCILLTKDVSKPERFKDVNE